jgi:hypothetical protein
MRRILRLENQDIKYSSCWGGLEGRMPSDQAQLYYLFKSFAFTMHVAYCTGGRLPASVSLTVGL